MWYKNIVVVTTQLHAPLPIKQEIAKIVYRHFWYGYEISVTSMRSFTSFSVILILCGYYRA